MTQRVLGRTATIVLLWALVLSLFFVYCEMLKACRTSQWAGWDLWAAVGLTVGTGVYWGVFVALIAGMAAVLGRAGRGVVLSDMAWAGCALAAGAAVWVALSRYREFSPTLDDAVVLAGLGGVCSAYLGMRRLIRISPARCLALLVLVLAGGLGALVSTGWVFLFEETRARAVTLYPAAWLASAGIGSLVLYAATQRKRLRLRAVFALAVIGLPPFSAWLLTYTPARTPSDRRPNLVLIVADALRADRLGLHGGPAPTPCLDKLASNASVFDKCYSLAPWTMPSMSALFSSDYPPGLTPNLPGDQWLTQIWMYKVAEGKKTLATLLKDQGYATGAFVANALLWYMPGMMDGFDTIGKAHPVLLAPEGLLSHLPFLQAALAAHWPACDGVRPQDTTARMTRYAKAWLRRHRNKPFFLWVHYMDPHAPCDPPARFRRVEGPWPFFHPYKGGERWNIPILGPDFALRQEDQSYVRALYDGESQYIDEQVGGLVARLSALGAGENTYLCFVSDHGEELWEHGDWGHGQSVHQELLHVPLLIAGPGVRGQRIAENVSEIDLIPTLAGLMGVTPPPEWRGQDLTPVLRGETSAAPRPVFAQGTSNRCWPHPQQAVIYQGWKLIREAGSEVRRLYNLDEDPGEVQDIAAQHPERVEELDQFLREWRATFPSEFPRNGVAPENGTQDEMLQNLRGMGYL